EKGNALGGQGALEGLPVKGPVDDQPALATGLLRQFVAEAAHVGILGDETPAVPIDHHPLDEAVGWADGAPGGHRVHLAEVPAHAVAQGDAAAVAAEGPEGYRLLVLGGVGLHHVAVEGKTAGTEDHTVAGPHQHAATDPLLELGNPAGRPPGGGGKKSLVAIEALDH